MMPVFGRFAVVQVRRATRRVRCQCSRKHTQARTPRAFTRAQASIAYAFALTGMAMFGSVAQPPPLLCETCQ